MRCPFCGHEDTQVKDSRPSEDGGAIRRRRFCANCGQRFTTIERTQLRELTVVKSDARRVPFEREKLARGSSMRSSASCNRRGKATSPRSRSANW